jgi:hypothetical protein
MNIDDTTGLLVGSLRFGEAYSPADFADADDMRPVAAACDIGGHGSSTPYSGAVNALMSKHMTEVKGAAAATLNLRTMWRRRLLDFVAKKNTELLDFIQLSPSSHTTISKAEALLRRFGNPQVHPNHASVRDLVIDVSGGGAEIMAEIGAAFENTRGEGGLKDYANQTELLFQEYRMAGEEIMRAQAALNTKLNKLDKVQGRLSTLMELEPNDCYEPLMQATEAYLKKIFEENQIREDYDALVAAYRRFVYLREIVVMSRTLGAHEAQPACSVCIQEPVTFAVTPCGHTYCQNCCRKQGSSCFICRTHIKDTVKLYFA